MVKRSMVKRPCSPYSETAMFPRSGQALVCDGARLPTLRKGPASPTPTGPECDQMHQPRGDGRFGYFTAPVAHLLLCNLTWLQTWSLTLQTWSWTWFRTWPLTWSRTWAMTWTRAWPQTWPQTRLLTWSQTWPNLLLLPLMLLFVM